MIARQVRDPGSARPAGFDIGGFSSAGLAATYQDFAAIRNAW
jgi:hypothetical protein